MYEVHPSEYAWLSVDLEKIFQVVHLSGVKLNQRTLSKY